MVFTLFAICITVAEVALGLAIVILLFRMRRTATADHVDWLKGCDGEDPITLALIALLLPAAAFLVDRRLLAAAPSGRPAAFFSIACVARRVRRGDPGVARWQQPSARADSRRLDVAARRSASPFATVGVLVDSQSTTMLVLVTLVALLVQIYSLGYLSDEPRPALGRYYAHQSLFAFSMMGVVLAPNLLQLFICWELVGVCSYLLIGFWYRKPEAARAALKAFWTTKLGDVGLLIGIVLLQRATGTFDLVELRQMAEGEHSCRLPGSASSPSASTSARWGSRRSSRCTSGCPTRWKGRRRSRR